MGHRDGDEEAGNIWHKLHALFLRFLHEDRCSVLDELEILRSLCVQFPDLLRVLTDADHHILGCAIAIRPRRAAGVLIDIHEFLDDILVRRNTDHRPHALAIHGEALRQRVRTHHQDISRKPAEDRKELPALLLLAAIVQVRHVRDKHNALRLILRGFSEHIDSGLPLGDRETIARGIVGDTIQDDHQIVLLREDLIHLRLEIRRIEMPFRRQERESAHLAVVIIDEAIISAPVPIGNQHLIAHLGIIVHHMMQHPCAAGRRASVDISRRTRRTETLINAVIQERAIPLDRRIGADFSRRQVLEFLLHHVEHHQTPILIQDRAHRRIHHILGADLLRQSDRPIVRCKNIILRTLPLRMRRCYTVHTSSSFRQQKAHSKKLLRAPSPTTMKFDNPIISRFQGAGKGNGGEERWRFSDQGSVISDQDALAFFGKKVPVGRMMVGFDALAFFGKKVPVGRMMVGFDALAFFGKKA